ncbi:MAG TPA: hypothetical protein VMU36_06405, partial [Spirochaetia bacterium]|nr:hypothetical protein [Spirochaetia bacterium]
SSRANLENGSRRYVFGPRLLNLKLEPEPGKVLFVGQLQLTYKRAADTLAFRPEIDYEVRSFGGMAGVSPGFVEAVSKLDRTYDVTLSQKIDDTELLSYMKRVDPSSPWLSRDIVDFKIPTSTAQ